MRSNASDENKDLAITALLAAYSYVDLIACKNIVRNGNQLAMTEEDAANVMMFVDTAKELL